MNGCDMNDIINIYLNYFFALCLKIAKSICNANSSKKHCNANLVKSVLSLTSI